MSGLEEFLPKPAMPPTPSLEFIFENELGKPEDPAANNVAKVAWDALKAGDQLENSLAALVSQRPVTDPISIALIRLHVANQTPLPQGA